MKFRQLQENLRRNLLEKISRKELTALGLSVEETAAALGISEESVLRDWRLARVWLAHELRHGERDGQRALAQD